MAASDASMPLFPALPPSAIEGLIYRLARQHTECDGYPARQGCLHDGRSHWVINVFVVRCLTLNDRSKTDDGRKLPAFRQTFRGQGNLERSGDANHRNPIISQTVSTKRIDGPVKQSVRNKIIESRDDDRHANIPGKQIPLQYVRHLETSKDEKQRMKAEG